MRRRDKPKKKKSSKMKARESNMAESILRLEVKTVFKTNTKVFLFTKIH